MKKTTQTALALARTTIRVLQPVALGQVNGGGPLTQGARCDTSGNTCFTCVPAQCTPTTFC